MDTIEIALDIILPNPWQPRESESPDHVRKIAQSIAQNGLMQAPVCRCVDLNGKPVLWTGSTDMAGLELWFQLAFGHSRLAAFRLLKSQRLDDAYSRMPLVVQNLTDEEMFRMGIGENLARKDLTPIEEAKAMMRYREDFGKTSSEIGELFGLSDSAVRNKMRLLTLPQFLQDALRQGDLTEGAGRALIALYDIPEAARLEAEDSDDIKPSEILEAARSGLAPARISEMVAALAERMAPRPAQLSILVDPGINSRAMDEEKGAEAAETARPVEPVYEKEEELEAFDEEEEESPQKDDEIAEQIAENPMMGEYDPAGEIEEEAPSPLPGLKSGAMPASTIAPAPAPAPIPPVKVGQKAAPKPEPQPQPAPAAPAPAPAPAPVTWEQSTILLSLTLWPEDSHGGRMVSIGGRVNQGNPKMVMASLADLELPWQLAEMIEQLKNGGVK